MPRFVSLVVRFTTKITTHQKLSLLVRPLAQAIKVYNDTSRMGSFTPHMNRVNNRHTNAKNSRVGTRIFRHKPDNMSKNNANTRPVVKRNNEVKFNDNKTKGVNGSAFGERSSEVNKDTIPDAFHACAFIAKPHITSPVKGGHMASNRPENNGLLGNNSGSEYKLLFDIANSDDDKYINSVIFNDQNNIVNNNPCVAYDKWCVQSKFKFGFIPLTDPMMPKNEKIGKNLTDPIEIHKEVQKYDLPNYLGARIPVKSQLNIEAWEELLQGYWDSHLLECLKFGFPLGFNRMCPLRHDKDNHKSASEFPEHVDKYIAEELALGAILGPFDHPPIENLHYSPFMTRPKQNSDTRRVILDLSWPKGESVNAGVEKNGYMGGEFKLTFPTIDDLTRQLVKIGRGAHIFKVDVSRAFRHLSVDPRDYDLLGVNWGATFIDARIPFGSRHGSQFFQRASDAVRHVMRQQNVDVINYIDDFLGYGTPSVARHAFDALLDVMKRLGLDISEKKLVHPTTRAVCLGILIDTIEGTVAVPPDKLEAIKSMIIEWRGKRSCTKRQLQSLLGSLLYIHKCVKPARYFLNRMLATLRDVNNPARIVLNDDFQRDLAWFEKFLPQYNGVSMYVHKNSDSTLELDACLTGLGGHWGQYVYHLPISRGFANLDIVHLEMVNIVVALRLFARLWSGTRVLIRCDNDAVVKVLNAGKARDPFLGACAHNV